MQEWLGLTLGGSTDAAAREEANAIAEARGADGSDVTTADPQLGADEPGEVRAAPARTVEMVEAEINALLAQLPETAGPRTMAELGGLMMQIIQIGGNIQQAVDQGTIDASQLPEILGGLQNQTTNLSKLVPTIGLTLASIPADQLGIDVLAGMLPSGDTLGTQEGLVFRNTQILSNLFFQTHPEYWR